MVDQQTASVSSADLNLEGQCLKLSGVVDKHSVSGLHKKSVEIARSDNPPTEVCLEAVAHIDSAGLALLLEWRSWARRAGQQLSLSHAPRQLRMLARLSQLDEVLGLE